MCKCGGQNSKRRRRDEGDAQVSSMKHPQKLFFLVSLRHSLFPPRIILQRLDFFTKKTSSVYGAHIRCFPKHKRAVSVCFLSTHLVFKFLSHCCCCHRPFRSSSWKGYGSHIGQLIKICNGAIRSRSRRKDLYSFPWPHFPPG